ncbi:MAG: TetR/AcrR family transcriptional regulator [Alteriqipengyuania sp.]
MLKAGELMADKGYDGASMRDIAAAVGMLPGSVYYHFPSKEALFVELHHNIVTEMTQRVQDAIAAADNPWDRLENAACAHAEGLLETGNLVAIVSPQFAHQTARIEDVIREERRNYENIFRDLFEALNLPPEADATLLRLQLFGTLNWVPVWFRKGGKYSGTHVARQAVRVMRRAYSEAG